MNNSELKAFAPTIKSHGIVFQRIDGGQKVLSVPVPANESDGSVVIVSVGRGNGQAFELPTDRAGQLSIHQLGDAHAYIRYPNSGTALYAAVASRHEATSIDAVTPAEDEITLATVVVAGTKIQDFVWNEVIAGRWFNRNKIRTKAVTTTGPATLVAFWWGDAGVRNDKKARPNNGFRVIDSVLESGALVQCAVAVKRVESAGTYDVTWKAEPVQGAQLWLLAVQ